MLKSLTLILICVTCWCREEGFASLGWRETLLSRGHRDKRQVTRSGTLLSRGHGDKRQVTRSGGTLLSKGHRDKRQVTRSGTLLRRGHRDKRQVTSSGTLLSWVHIDKRQVTISGTLKTARNTCEMEARLQLKELKVHSSGRQETVFLFWGTGDR
jgi:hypothetical protein